MRYIRKLSAAAGAGCLAAALAGTAATPAFADYGTGAQYQIEISANNVGGVPSDGSSSTATGAATTPAPTASTPARPGSTAPATSGAT